jgi:hypothetical protein
MGEALERVLADGPRPENRAGIAAPLLELVAQDLLRFGDRGRHGPAIVGSPIAGQPGVRPGSPDLPARLLGYVLDGDDPQVLAEIKVSGGYAIGGGDVDRDGRAVRWRIYDHWEELPPPVLLRLARVLAAGSQIVANRPILDLSQHRPWVEALARDLAGLPISHGLFPERVFKPHVKARFEWLAALMAIDDLPVQTFLRSVMASQVRDTPPDSADFLAAFPGFGAALAAHRPAVAPLFQKPPLAQKLRALSLLAAAGKDAQAAFASELVDLALDAGRQVRDAAWTLAKGLRERAVARARQQAVEATPERRVLALRLLWETDLPGERDFVRERGSADNAGSVRKAVAGLVSTLENVVNAPPTAPQVPVVRIDVAAPTSPEARELLRSWLATADAVVPAVERKFHLGGQRFSKPLSDVVEEIVARVEDPRETAILAKSRFWWLWNVERETQHRNVARWLAAPGVQVIHLVRLLRMTGQIQEGDRHDWTISYAAELALRKSIGDLRRGSLLEFARACEAEGIPVSTVIRHWYRPHGWLTRGWPDDAVWPFFAAYPEALDPGFDTSSPYAKEWDFNRLRVFDALATFPILPPERVAAIVEAALGTSKQVRASAQRVLDKHPDRLSFACEGLANGRAETRMAAAQWLTRLKDRAAIEPLEQAFRREKNDAVQGAILTALEAIGAALDRYLSATGLAKAAGVGLKKGVPRDLAWFPFDQLPRVRWQAKDEPVAGDVLRWLLVQSCRLKTPEPGALLRRYCTMLRAEDREALGAFVLSAWMAQDLRPAPREVAEQRAHADAQQWQALFARYPKGFQDDPLKAMTPDQLFAHHLQGHLRWPGGSAIGAKGVLALAAACGGAQIAPAAQKYLKEWYGQRAGQGKALIQMLAWVEHPAAIQLMLSVGSRFRTKGFQEEATRQAQLLAERKGWTLDELADRTIPAAGFDENGTLELDYGGRRFIARLREDMTIGVETADGKPVTALPDARKDDDEARVKEAKKRLAAARKELKGILTLQEDRLYEAMCTGRTWRYEDWSTYLLQHPVVRRHCQRLVWRASENGEWGRTFRPLDDGTLTDADDNRVTLPPDAAVCVAHDTSCDALVCEAWLKHFKDYGLTPLFQQFGRGRYILPGDRREATSLTGFEGHMIDAFKLRGATGKLGYMRGATEDGGWFYAYTKRFTSLGMEAVMGFSGNALPEENRKVALMDLSFRRDRGAEVPLAEVPAVILSECLADMRTVAAEGSGFDPDWQSKVER